MEPLSLTLLGYPLSILANFTYDQLKKVSQKMDINPLRRLFLDAFYKSLKYHDKYYDDYSRKIVAKMGKTIKKDEEKLLVVFSRNSEDFNKFLALVKSMKFQQKVAEELVSEYSLDLNNYPKLMVSIIKDCLSYYLSSFFNQMNEKEGIQAILIECLKLNTALDILKKIDSQIVTKDDFDELRKIVLFSYYKGNSEAQKHLRDYDRYIRNKFKYLELRGFSPKISGKEVQMELLDVFVPLQINIENTIVPNILEEKALLEKRSLKNDKTNDIDDKKKDPIVTILEKRSLVILGDPGSGKSTLMKYLAIKVSHLRNSKDLLAKIIPIYFRISDYADYFKKTKKSIYEFITEHCDKQYQHIFKESFECSNILLLMDGLDEITDTPLRIRVTEQVMDLFARYPYNRYVVTSRIVGYQESKLGGEFNHYKLMPFGSNEIELFSEHWYKSIAQHTDKDYSHASEQAESLYISISRNPSVIRLATNPLLMTVIAMIHYKGKKLPNKRVELYDVSTETFLEYWVQLRMDDESQLKDKNEIVEILAPIAFEIHKNKSNALIEENEFVESFLRNFKNLHTNTSDKDSKRECKEFINFLRQQAGFFYEKGVDDDGNRFYGFIHLTFEEYLAAIELISMWNEGELQLEDYVLNSRWIEIIRLAASQLRLSYKGRTGRIQSTKFLKDILDIEDPFPEACRPLQLAFLILSDDVNIADELLNSILDMIIDVISKSKFYELIESFSKLFKEVLYSEFRDAFIRTFEKEVITENPTLRDNIIYLLLSNSWDRDVNEVLISLLNKNEKIRRAIYQIEWGDFPFQESECYKNNFYNNLLYLESQDDNEGIMISTNNVIRSIIREPWYAWRNKENVQVIIKALEQYQDTKVFDIILRDILDLSLDSYLRHSQKEVWYTLLKRYPDNFLVKNLNKSINGVNFEHITRREYSAGARCKLEHYDLLLRRGDDLLLWFWSRNFDKLFYHSVSSNDISCYLKRIKSSFSESDIKNIERNIYFILGPKKSSDSAFVTANEDGLLFDFFGWENYPFKKINSNPQVMSKIIVQHGRRYLERSLSDVKEKQLELKTLNNERISPPAKLLIHHHLNKPYDQRLLNESILHLQNCSSEEKEGTFSILYQFLNPFQLS